MPLRMGHLYDALLSSGIDKSLAEKASEEVASYENKLSKMDTKLSVLTAIVTINTTISLAMLWILYNILARLGGNNG